MTATKCLGIPGFRGSKQEGPPQKRGSRAAGHLIDDPHNAVVFGVGVWRPLVLWGRSLGSVVFGGRNLVFWGGSESGVRLLFGVGIWGPFVFWVVGTLRSSLFWILDFSFDG
jgi:hypothetical protein